MVLEALRALPADGRESVRKVHGEVVGYFENHVHRMDYPTYQAKGWAIGSGPIESACKTVIGKRMKEAGCAGARTGPMRCATCVPCSPAERTSGMPTGIQPELNRAIRPGKPVGLRIVTQAEQAGLRVTCRRCAHTFESVAFGLDVAPTPGGSGRRCPGQSRAA